MSFSIGLEMFVVFIKMSDFLKIIVQEVFAVFMKLSDFLIYFLLGRRCLLCS